MHGYSQHSAGNDRYSWYGAHQNKIYSLSQMLDLPVDDILSAVQEVGFDTEAIEEYIRDRYNRC